MILKLSEYISYLGITLTNRYEGYNEIRRRINNGSFYYYSVQKLLTRLLPKP
jgi:hypothetical protein